MSGGVAAGSGSPALPLGVGRGTEGFPGEDCSRASHAVNNPSAQPCSSEIPLVPLGISCHLGSALWNNSASIKTKQKNASNLTPLR